MRKIPVNKTESSNFYFLVKVCGISPLDIPHMSPFQVKTLIHQHNKYEEKKQKEIDEMKKKAERNSPKKAKLRRGR